MGVLLAIVAQPPADAVGREESRLAGQQEVVLIDAATGVPLADRVVTLRSDSGVRCIQAPCGEQSDRSVRADARGRVRVPTPGTDTVMVTIVVPDYVAPPDAAHLLAQARGREVKLEYVPNALFDDAHLGHHPIKLVDAATDRALGDRHVEITFGLARTVSMRTNALGYLFVPGTDAIAAFFETSVLVEGYRPHRLDFTPRAYRTLLTSR